MKVVDIFNTSKQIALDKRCIQWQHLFRNIAYCINPHCPGKDPGAIALRELQREVAKSG